MIKKTKVIFILPSLSQSGAERVITTIANKLPKNEFEVSILTLRSDSPDKLALMDDLEPTVKIIHLNCIGRLFKNLLSLPFKIRACLIRERADVAVFCSGTINAYFSLFLKIFPKNTKYFARESNLPSLYNSNFIINFLYKLTYKNYEKIIVQSDDMQLDLQVNFGISAGKLIKINNPVDCDRIVKMSYEKPSVEVDKNKINIICVGRLTYQKGLDIAINLFASIRHIEKYRLLIVGAGEEKEMLLELIVRLKLLDYVRIVDPVSNPWSIMSNCDMLLSTSRWEGYPNIVLEACALSLPVLMSPFPGGSREIFSTLGVSELVPDRDFECQIVQCINLKLDSGQFSSAVIDRMKSYQKILSVLD